jgi:hypothetical protein
MPGMWIVPFVAESTGSWGWAWTTLTPGTLVAFIAMIMMRTNKIGKRVARERGRPVM